MFNMTIRTDNEEDMLMDMARYHEWAPMRRMAVGGMRLAVGIVRVAAEPLHRRPAALPRCVHHGAGTLCADTDDIGLSRAVVSMDGGQCAGVLHVAESRRLLHRRAIPLLVHQLHIWLLPLDKSAERIKDEG